MQLLHYGFGIPLKEYFLLHCRRYIECGVLGCGHGGVLCMNANVSFYTKILRQWCHMRDTSDVFLGLFPLSQVAQPLRFDNSLISS
jgi:hypothetical protein